MRHCLLLALPATAALLASAPDLDAFWYRLPPLMVRLPHVPFEGHVASRMHVYLPLLRSEAVLNVTARGQGRDLFRRRLVLAPSQAPEDVRRMVLADRQRLSLPVPQLETLPETIELHLEVPGQAARSRTVACRYHLYSGTVKDLEGRPFRAYVDIKPDASDNEIQVQADAAGHYAVQLPARTYNAVFVDGPGYRKETLENWVWRLDLDRDERMDFVVHQGELYDVHLWPSNGGFKVFHVAFRPMTLAPQRQRPLPLGGATVNLYEIGPDLRPGDLSFTLNGQPLKLLSLQPFHQADAANAMQAWIATLERPEGLAGKQTLRVEMRSRIRTEAGETSVYSRAFHQFRLTPSGRALE